jgi:hypothetical protein
MEFDVLSCINKQMHSIDEFLAKKICKKEISSGSTE